LSRTKRSEEKEVKGGGTSFAKPVALRIVFFSKHYWSSEMKKDEIVEAS